MAATDPQDVAPVEPDAQRSLEELDQAIHQLAGRMQSASHRLLVMVREFDERRGWVGWALVLVGTASDVAVAHGIRTLRSDPTAWHAAATGQFSLAGAQAKTALHHDPATGRWPVPAACRHPSTRR